MKKVSFALMAPFLVLGLNAQADLGVKARADIDGRVKAESKVENESKFEGKFEKMIEKRLENGKFIPKGIEKKVQNTTTVDTTAPAISGVSVVAKTGTSARVMWLTNERADTRVWLGTSSTVNTSSSPTVSIKGRTFFHSAKLVKLEPATIYFLVVGSADARGNLAVSGVQSFTTEPRPVDVTAPNIVAISDSSILGTSARVNLATNEETTARVLVSTTSPVVEAQAKVFADAKLAHRHTIELTGLTANTNYFYVVEVADASGNKTTSSVRTFATLTADVTAPSIIGTMAVSVDNDGARIIWLTNERADSRVWVSTSSPVSTSNAPLKMSKDLTFFHDMHLTGLTANTTYRVVVGSADASGNLSTGTEFSFTTSQ